MDTVKIVLIISAIAWLLQIIFYKERPGLWEAIFMLDQYILIGSLCHLLGHPTVRDVVNGVTIFSASASLLTWAFASSYANKEKAATGNSEVPDNCFDVRKSLFDNATFVGLIFTIIFM